MYSSLTTLDPQGWRSIFTACPVNTFIRPARQYIQQVMNALLTKMRLLTPPSQ